ncbi:MAG: hypothetical protein V1837_07685 [Candidatus Woesearchaeota archaeon]
MLESRLEGYEPKIIDKPSFVKYYLTHPDKLLADQMELGILKFWLDRYQQYKHREVVRKIHNGLTYIIDNYNITDKARNSLLRIRQGFPETDYSLLTQTVDEILLGLKKLSECRN